MAIAFIAPALAHGPAAAGSLQKAFNDSSSEHSFPYPNQASIDPRDFETARLGTPTVAPVGKQPQGRYAVRPKGRGSTDNQSRRRLGCLATANGIRKCRVIYTAQAKKKGQPKHKLKTIGPQERTKLRKKLIPLSKIPPWTKRMASVWTARKQGRRWRRFRRFNGKKISTDLRKAYADALKKQNKTFRLRQALRAVRRYLNLYKTELAKLRRRKLRPGPPRRGRMTMERTLENLKARAARLAKELRKQITIDRAIKAEADREKKKEAEKEKKEAAKKMKKTKKKCKGGGLLGGVKCGVTDKIPD